MYNMREIKEEDFGAVAKFEIEISEISFGEKAITDLEFHCKKLAKAKDRRGMTVIEDTESGPERFMPTSSPFMRMSAFEECKS